MPASKTGLRGAVRASRRAEADATAGARAELIAGHAPELAAWAAPMVAGYLPTNAEPDVGPLLRALAVPVVVPRVAGVRLEWVQVAAAGIVGMRRGIPWPDGPSVASGADLVTGLGVRLLLVPALAVDPANGTRLGYGAGYFDRLLAEIRHSAAPVPEPTTPVPEPTTPVPEPTTSVPEPTTPVPELVEGPATRQTGPSTSSGEPSGIAVVAVGVCRAADLLALPREPHDEPLDGVLTEHGLLWFRPRAPETGSR